MLRSDLRNRGPLRVVWFQPHRASAVPERDGGEGRCRWALPRVWATAELLAFLRNKRFNEGGYNTMTHEHLDLSGGK